MFKMRTQSSPLPRVSGPASTILLVGWRAGRREGGKEINFTQSPAFAGAGCGLPNVGRVGAADARDSFWSVFLGMAAHVAFDTR